MRYVDHTQSLDSASTSELVAELLNRIGETNGLECTDSAMLDELVGEIQTHLTGEDCTSRTQRDREVTRGSVRHARAAKCYYAHFSAPRKW